MRLEFHAMRLTLVNGLDRVTTLNQVKNELVCGDERDLHKKEMCGL
jgi:hypothetical protein